MMNTALKTENRQRALVVDDDPHWLLLIGQALSRERSGVEIDYDLSASDAIMKMKLEGPYDYVISDYVFKDATTGLDLWKMHSKLGHHGLFLLTSGQSVTSTSHEGPRFIAKRNLLDELADGLGARPIAAVVEAAVAIPLKTRARTALQIVFFAIVIGVAELVAVQSIGISSAVTVPGGEAAPTNVQEVLRAE